jgi:hypothetical protein
MDKILKNGESYFVFMGLKANIKTYLQTYLFLTLSANYGPGGFIKSAPGS